MMRPIRNTGGQMPMNVIPFLLFAAAFITLYGLYYFFYSGSVNAMEEQLKVIEFQTEIQRAPGESIWANENIVFGDELRIPINDLKALRDEYGDGPHWDYTVSTFFIWRETFSLFEISVDHDSDIHGDNQLTVNITAYTDNETSAHGASWQDFEAPGYIHMGKTWFTTYGLKTGDLSGNLWGLLKDQLGITPQVPTGWPANVEIQVGEITRQVGQQPEATDIIWGSVEMKWGTYAGSVGEVGWVRSLRSMLTVDLPGMPAWLRVVFAAPIVLCVGLIATLFVKEVFFSI